MLTLLETAIGVKGQSLNLTATARLQKAGQLIAATGKRIVLAERLRWRTRFDRKIRTEFYTYRHKRDH